MSCDSNRRLGTDSQGGPFSRAKCKLASNRQVRFIIGRPDVGKSLATEKVIERDVLAERLVARRCSDSFETDCRDRIFF
jgi:hypothetical protein